MAKRPCAVRTPGVRERLHQGAARLQPHESSFVRREYVVCKTSRTMTASPPPRSARWILVALSALVIGGCSSSSSPSTAGDGGGGGGGGGGGDGGGGGGGTQY